VREPRAGVFFFSSRRRHTRCLSDWSSDVCSSDLYRRAMRELAAFFGCEAGEAAVYEHRLAADRDEYASALLRATNTELLLVDDEIGRASCRERGCMWGVAASVQ